MAGERHGHGMGMAWTRHAMCESALTRWHNWIQSAGFALGPINEYRGNFRMGVDGQVSEVTFSFTYGQGEE